MEYQLSKKPQSFHILVYFMGRFLPLNNLIKFTVITFPKWNYSTPTPRFFKKITTYKTIQTVCHAKLWLLCVYKFAFNLVIIFQLKSVVRISTILIFSQIFGKSSFHPKLTEFIWVHNFNCFEHLSVCFSFTPQCIK